MAEYVFLFFNILCTFVRYSFLIIVIFKKIIIIIINGTV